MNFFKLTICAATALSLPVLASAQAITACDWIGTAANIVEPWEVNSRTFANGDIRVAWVDTGGEPVCCSSHLMILSPSGDGSDEPSYRQCVVASAGPGMGFYSIDVPGIRARYDPAKGLSLSVPIGHWHEAIEGGVGPIPDQMEILINQATGAVVFD